MRKLFILATLFTASAFAQGIAAVERWGSLYINLSNVRNAVAESNGDVTLYAGAVGTSASLVIPGAATKFAARIPAGLSHIARVAVLVRGNKRVINLGEIVAFDATSGTLYYPDLSTEVLAGTDLAALRSLLSTLRDQAQ